MRLAQDRSKHSGTQVTGTHSYRHQQIASLKLQVASVLSDFVEAKPLQSSDEPFRSDNRQPRQWHESMPAAFLPNPGIPGIDRAYSELVTVRVPDKTQRLSRGLGKKMANLIWIRKELGARYVSDPTVASTLKSTLSGNTSIRLSVGWKRGSSSLGTGRRYGTLVSKHVSR